MGKNINLTGKRFGRLIVLALSHTKERGRKVWSCLCNCGGSTLATTETLNAGTKKSCGCLHAEALIRRSVTHGMSHSKEFRIWCSMRARCQIRSATGFSQYGARGISVCKEWESFPTFLADMGPCPPGTSFESYRQR